MDATLIIFRENTWFISVKIIRKIKLWKNAFVRILYRTSFITHYNFKIARKCTRNIVDPQRANDVGGNCVLRDD